MSDNIPTKDNPWSVGVYNRNLREHIAKVGACYITGEVISPKKYNNALYFTLKDSDSESRLSCSTFSIEVISKFNSIQEGNQVTILGKPDYWIKKGQLTVSVLDIEATGIGNKLQQIEMLKQKLATEQLFSNDHKLKLPTFPKVIGIICGKNAQAKDDVINNVLNRWPNIKFIIKEVSVGNSPNTPLEVIGALEQFKTNASTNPTLRSAPGANPETTLSPTPGATPSPSSQVDLIVITRGGGAFEEVVFPFSDEQLIRYVYNYSIPVVSAIGHETDTPLLDFVADFRASTPTDAAKNIVPSVFEELGIVEHYKETLNVNLQNKLNFESERINNLNPTGRMNYILQLEQEKIQQIASRPVLINPINMLDPHREKLASLSQKLDFNILQALGDEERIFKSLQSKLVVLSPLSTLDRGYSITKVNGAVLNSIDNANIGDGLEIIIKDGTVLGTIQEKERSSYE
jgi:exodeoxyribonuclease VII large subunit